MADKIKIIDTFFGGNTRDDKSTVTGAVSNAEEVDIFTNKNYVQAEQIMTADALPATSELYSFCVSDADVVYGYGKETGANKVRIFNVNDGGGSNPGAWATLFTSSDATDLAISTSPIAYHKTSEAGNHFLYYIAGASATWKLVRYNITTPGEADVGTLTGLTGSYDRPTMRRFFGELFITHGQYIAKVDDDGTFTEKAWTLPNSQIAVDIIPVSDVAIVLARNTNRYINETTGYWWDLESSAQFDDQFKIPMGGGQWIASWKERIIIFCAINGIGKFYQLSGAYPGAQPLEIPDRLLLNVGTETTTQPISSSKMVSQKDGVLYFGIYKTDKTGIYALGQIDSDAPIALVLAKRFLTTDYSAHKPTGLLIHGSNFYGAYDNSGALCSRCESTNSPSRSSNAVIETIWHDYGTPLQKKDLTRAYINAYPLVASTSLNLYIASDFGTSYTQVKRPDDSVFNTTNGLLGLFRPSQFCKKFAFKAKISFTSSSTNSPKLQSIGLRVNIKDAE